VTPEFGYVEFESIEAAERALKCESHVILSYKVTVENHRNGLATAKMLNQVVNKPKAPNGKPSRANRQAKPNSSEEASRGLQFESSGKRFGHAEQTYEDYLADDDDDEAFQQDLEDEQEDISEDEESEESESEDEEEELPEGEPETRLGDGQKDPLSSAEQYHNSGCASNPYSNSLGERNLKYLQPLNIDGKPVTANSPVLLSQFRLNSARSPLDFRKTIVGCNPECTPEPSFLQEASHLKRLICRHSRKIRSQENENNYKLNKETVLAFRARLLRLASSQQQLDINPSASMHSLTPGTNLKLR